MNTQWKQALSVAGILLFLAGLMFAFGTICLLLLALGSSSSQDKTAVIISIMAQTLALFSFSAGFVIFTHADGSIRNKPSKPLQLPPMLLLLLAFIFLLMLGLAVSTSHIAPGLFLSPFFWMLAMLPPLWAVSWFTPPVSAANPQQSKLTWRRGLVAFCTGAIFSTLLALALEIAIPLAILSLAFTTGQTVLDQLGDAFTGTYGAPFARAMTNPAFVYVFIQIAVIAPLVDELVKPLVTLPLLRQLNRQEAFWVGALAGAGFAAVENVIYAASGFPIWAGVLAVRALGGALHPLCTGLVTLGWRDALNGEPNALEKWFKQYGFAVLIHAIWNGGSLLVITLGSVQVFGILAPEIDVLGLSMGGITLGFLILLGIAALWLGRAYGYNRPLLAVPEAETDSASEAGFVLSERTTALWALACLLAIVPIGIAGLKLWLR